MWTGMCCCSASAQGETNLSCSRKKKKEEGKRETESERGKRNRVTPGSSERKRGTSSESLLSGSGQQHSQKKQPVTLEARSNEISSAPLKRFAGFHWPTLSLSLVFIKAVMMLRAGVQANACITACLLLGCWSKDTSILIHFHL